jgi:hypothetical protein
MKLGRTNLCYWRAPQRQLDNGKYEGETAPQQHNFSD